ncbi:ribbon-helix-helix domain-containing protein [Tardiphaga sp.]|jgi:predicted DNA-binding ribbon-helix-helix protein|uniref:ribbon-helix-helix domain-containing protein n=1 Tax=Tardiphaga sp. TaxID=1926292 RepID=UPI0025E03EBF|nr:ribbon-helix-helix domain-containing protein [Tardiphaga sp.]
MGHEAATLRPNVNRKRSVVVSKKRTSVSLEDSFWVSLQAIVRMENTTIEHYIEKIERKRETPNLSSNLRIAVLEYFQQIAARSIVSSASDATGGVSPYQDHHGESAEKVVAYWNKLDAKEPLPT